MEAAPVEAALAKPRNINSLEADNETQLTDTLQGRAWSSPVWIEVNRD